jgi:FkbM family methyltransferase
MSRLRRWLQSLRSTPPTPYEHLLRTPRFEVRTEQLLGKPFRIADSISFHASYREIFVNELYRFHTSTLAPLIIDCGANCGVSVIYFKWLYPAAKIIAIEADPEIFALLKWNVSSHGLTDVTLINKAIAVGTEPVTFHREGADAGRIHFMSGAKARLTVPVISLDQLLAQGADLLKMDIEGAETDVLRACDRLTTVSQLMVEYHSFADASQGLHEMLTELAAAGFRYYVQTQFCPTRPLVEDTCHLGMDLQLNVFAKRTSAGTTVVDPAACPTRQRTNAELRRVA